MIQLSLESEGENRIDANSSFPLLEWEKHNLKNGLMDLISSYESCFLITYNRLG
jgi:hypothetical protein